MSTTLDSLSHYTPSTPPSQNRPSLERNAVSEMQSPRSAKSVSNQATTITARPRRQTISRHHLVFPDPIAFRYLEEDSATTVIDRRRRLEGYQIYIVEQWACSRTHPTFLICTYTGDSSHSILVNVLGVPNDQDSWSPRLKLYFQAVSMYHAREKDTPLGSLMVTNLSGLPSALTVIAVPDGDVRKHKDDFIVNENLKRMGCSGRAAMNLQQPQSSTIAKFHQLYRTSESVGIYQSVTEIVKICQMALAIYDKLEQTYADGLLCDITEKAVNDWWTEIGTYFYNVEPSDGIFGPTTVAAVLGLLIGAHNRLKTFGAPVGKDILDLVSMKRAIGYFQKASKMERSRRLDRETLDRLHRVTAKSASGEGWTVPKAVKSTVAELSGKGGEMMMGIVGAGREKAGISEAETLDIDRFAQLVTGPKMKWLWQGKQMKSGEILSVADDDLNGRVFSTDDQGGFIWRSSRQASVIDPVLERSETISSLQPPEGKSGLGRIKEAVGGLKPHGQRAQRDGEDMPDHEDRPATPTARSSFRDQLQTSDRSAKGVGQAGLDLALSRASPEAQKRSSASLKPAPVRNSAVADLPPHREQLRPAAPAESPRKKKIQTDMADLREEFKAAVYQNFSAEFEYHGPRTRALQRSRSAIQVVDPGPDNPRQNRLLRQLSFSLVENAVLGYRDCLADDDEDDPKSGGEQRPAAAMASRDAFITVAERKSRRILRVQQALIPFTEARVSHVENLDRDAAQHLEELNNLYYQKLEEYQVLRATSSDVVAQEKTALTESLRRLEMLGAKLDYELNALHSRMQEAEAGVGEFERSVQVIEARVKELAGSEDKVSTPWLTRLVNFVGSRK